MQTYSDFRLYAEWVQAHDTLADKDRQAIRECVRQMTQAPLFSIVLLPAPDGAKSAANASIASVRNQLYPHWELWLPHDLKPSDGDTEWRFRTISGSIARVTDHASLFNAALAAADGEFVLPLPPDATMAEQALYEMAVAIGDDSQADLLYTDEDRLDASGTRCMPHFKTAWDPDLMLGRDAVGLLVAYSRALLKRLGGMRGCLPLLALYELSLRTGFAASPGHIHHVPAVLCHRHGSSGASLAWDAEGARAIVRRHLAESGVTARVVAAPLAAAWNRVVRELPDPVPLVSVIVPTRDRADLLGRCAEAVLSCTDYPAIELMIVDNDSSESATFELFHRLSRDPRVRILRSPGPFNYSAQNNQAAREALGEILLLLNNDTDILKADWLREMVSHAVRPDVGAVGAKLLYPDEQVQHAGVVLGPDRAITHQLRFSRRLDPGPNCELALTRTVSAVTGACLAIRRSVFVAVGGLDENLRVAFNDIDLCMRLGDHGYRVVWTPFAELLHYEGASRGFDITPEAQAIAVSEHTYFCGLWGTLTEADRFSKSEFDLRVGHYKSRPTAAAKLVARPPVFPVDRKQRYKGLN